MFGATALPSLGSARIMSDADAFTCRSRVLRKGLLSSWQLRDHVVRGWTSGLRSPSLLVGLRRCSLGITPSRKPGDMSDLAYSTTENADDWPFDDHGSCVCFFMKDIAAAAAGCGRVSPVSSVYLQSALCLCCTFSIFVGSSCPVSGKAHIGYKVLSYHVSVWSLIPQQWLRSTVPEQSRAA